MLYIVTPCRNAAKTISHTIDSVVTQHPDTLIRYHIQDGISTDGTLQILANYEEYITKHPDLFKNLEFSWCSEADSGMYDAISKGFASLNIPPNALMGWLNADDVFCPGALDKVQEAAESLMDVDWLGGVPLVIDMDGAPISRGRPGFAYPQALIAQGTCDGLHWRTLQQEGTFWRKRLWDVVGGLDCRYRLVGDWDLWRRMAQHAEYVQLSQPLAGFRKHPGQLSEGKSYSEEIEAALSARKRCAAFRRHLPKALVTATAFACEKDGTWSIQRVRPNLSWKDAIGLILSFFGLYQMFSWCQKINTKLQQLVKQSGQ